MTKDTVRAAFERVLTQTAGMNGPAGFISADVDLLRDDHRQRLVRAQATIAETSRILARTPQRKPVANKSPARKRLEQRITIASAKLASAKLTVALESFRRLLSPPNTN